MLTEDVLSKNAILDVLARADSGSLADIRLVDLEREEMLVPVGAPIDRVYFPVDAVISVVNLLKDGASIEVGTVGREGTTGVYAALGATSVPNLINCQVDGQCFVMSRVAFELRLASIAEFRVAVSRFTLAYLNVMAQLVACNRSHSIDQRCARWLLITLDRVGRPTFPLTQEYLAMMMGVSRSGVNAAASAYAAAGFITYSRGSMTVLDRDRLMAESCECYERTRAEFSPLLVRG